MEESEDVLTSHRKIAKYAAQCGNTAAEKHFAKEFPSLGESTVLLFKKQYQADLKKVGSEEDITQPVKRRGRLSLNSQKDLTSGTLPIIGPMARPAFAL